MSLFDCEKEISKEIYDQVQANNGVVSWDVKRELFTSAALYGYGIYGASVFEKDGKYMMRYSTSDSCD